MEISVNTPVTFESILANLKEVTLSFEKLRLAMEQSSAEAEKQKKEWDEKFEKSRAEAKRQKKEWDEKSDREKKEWDEKSDREKKEWDDKFDREKKEWDDKFDREKKEWDEKFEKKMKAEDRRLKKLDETVNGMTKSNGLFAEDYFFNSFEKGKRTFFGEKFGSIRRNVPAGLEGSKDEYDLVLVNGKSIGIIEVKYKARLDDIPGIIKQAETFRINYPKYQNHGIYLALASFVFNQRLEQECAKYGIAIVKQVGNNWVVNEEHLKTY